MNAHSLPPALDSLDPHVREFAPVLFVPVDATEASRRIVDRAIELAQLRSARIVLVGLSRDPAEDDLDLELVTALMMAAELGFGTTMLQPADDDEARLTRLVRLVLVPLQRRLQAAGVPVEIRVVQAPCAAAQLRGIVEETPSSRQLILGDPERLEGALRMLTLDLLAAPPCSQLLTDHDRRPVRRPAGPVSRLVARLVSSLTLMLLG